jgi:hypothetical protein
LQEAAYRIAAEFWLFMWAPGTLLIVALSIAHVWVGTAWANVEAVNGRGHR